MSPYLNDEASERVDRILSSVGLPAIYDGLKHSLSVAGYQTVWWVDTNTDSVSPDRLIRFNGFKSSMALIESDLVIIVKDSESDKFQRAISVAKAWGVVNCVEVYEK